MKYLFVHQNFPAQYLHLLRRLVDQGQHDIVFLTEENDNSMQGVRKFVRRAMKPDPSVNEDAADFDLAMRRARAVERQAAELQRLGFEPDIILGHHGWGELLNVCDVWPEVPVLGYHEFYYTVAGTDVGFDPEFPLPSGAYGKVRARNATNLLALNNRGYGQTPTKFQFETYPEWARTRISVLAEGVDLGVCRPDPDAKKTVLDVCGFKVEPGDALVTFVARDLEPYRGFHVLMRALPRLHRLRPDLKVVLVGGDGVSYGARLQDRTWREHMMAEVGSVIDPSRVCFPGRVPYDTFLKLLQRSDTHIYLTYPFVLSWSLREALACGCAIVASDTAPVREFVTHRKTGLLTPFPDPTALAEAVSELLADRALNARLRRAARRFAEKTLDLDRYLCTYERLIAAIAEAS